MQKGVRGRKHGESKMAPAVATESCLDSMSAAETGYLFALDGLVSDGPKALGLELGCFTTGSVCVCVCVWGGGGGGRSEEHTPELRSR